MVNLQSRRSLYMGRLKDVNKNIRWILIQAANTAAKKRRGHIAMHMVII
jgi:hypothetical protein